MPSDFHPVPTSPCSNLSGLSFTSLMVLLSLSPLKATKSLPWFYNSDVWYTCFHIRPVNLCHLTLLALKIQEITKSYRFNLFNISHILSLLFIPTTTIIVQTFGWPLICSLFFIHTSNISIISVSSFLHFFPSPILPKSFCQINVPKTELWSCHSLGLPVPNCPKNEVHIPHPIVK